METISPFIQSTGHIMLVFNRCNARHSQLAYSGPAVRGEIEAWKVD